MACDIPKLLMPLRKEACQSYFYILYYFYIHGLFSTFSTESITCGKCWVEIILHFFIEPREGEREVG